MPSFNHYAKLKRILDEEPSGWHIVLINKPTTAANFRGAKVHFDHYYRLYHADGTQIRYGKFQQISRLARVLTCSANELPVTNQ